MVILRSWSNNHKNVNRNEKYILRVMSIEKKRWQKSPLVSFLLSLLFHAIFLFILCCGFFHRLTFLQPFVETSTKELPEVILDLSPPAVEKRPILQTDSAQPLEQAPTETSFESHENRAAASELPATGSDPLPSQEGDESNITQLKNAESSATTSPLSPIAPETEKKNYSTRALDDREARSSLEHPLESEKDPEGANLTREELTRNVSGCKEQPVMGKLSPSATRKGSSPPPSMIRGAISNKGKSSVASEATPIGRYKKTLADVISSHWYHSIDQRMELLSFGTATLIFYVNQQGKIEELHLLSNTSNQTFADCCLQSINEAKIPAIPAEIATTLEHGRLEIEYRFTIYPD